MKRQQITTSPFLTSSVLKEEFSSGSNFQDKLPQYLKQIDLKSTILQQEQTVNSQYKPRSFLQRQFKFAGQKNKLSSDIATLLETSNKMYYFLGRSTLKNYSEIAIYEYMKADGKLQHTELTGIKGVIMVIKAGFCPRRKSVVQKSPIQPSKTVKKSQSSKNQNENKYEVVILLGTLNGNLKTVRFSDSLPNNENIPKIQNRKLDHTSLIDVVILDPRYYSNANVCLALSMTNHTYLVNFDHMSLLALFIPTIVRCEVGLSLAVNYEKQYFLQACEGGYVIFWNIDEKIRGLIEKSIGQVHQNDKLPPGKPLAIKKESIEESLKAQIKPPTFKPGDLHYCISPICIFHSATITGIKFCQLYGDLLLIVAMGGVIKLIAINKSSHAHINQNEYCVLFQYQVQDGELISDVKFFPQTRDIFLVKNNGLQGVVEKSGSERYVHVREFAIKSTTKKKDKAQQNSFPFKPTFMRQIKRNLSTSQRPRSKSVSIPSSITKKKCNFERISFNLQLQIQQIDKVYPNHVMECIDGVDLVQDKDLVFLRGKEFYLVGPADFFKTVEID